MRIRSGVRNHTLVSIALENEMTNPRQMTKPQAVSPLRNNYLRFGNPERIGSAITFPQNLQEDRLASQSMRSSGFSM
jgi:hypothetical protein